MNTKRHCPHSTPLKQWAGFTLIELMVTIAIAAILVALAAPSFRTIVMNVRISSTSDALLNAMNYARNAALSGNVATTVCPIGAADSTTCGTDWSAGWMVVKDLSGTPVLMQSLRATTSNGVLSSLAINTTTPAAASVKFDPRGLSGAQAKFKLCDTRGSAFARSIYVRSTGAVQIGATPGTGVWDNTSLSCP
jgi:type IV fimbrial biogenesis protein FimT